MAMPPVHWHEGLFLRPHHFQAAERYLLDQNRQDHRFDVYYNWGLRSIELDLDALTNYRFVVQKLQARTRAGTIISVGSDLKLPELDLRPVMQQQAVGDYLTVLLAVPMLAIGRENTSNSPEARYRVDPSQEPLPDENSGRNERPVQFRRLNLYLKTDQDNTAGFDTIPIAKLRRSAQAGAPPQLDPDYIPPLLACDGWQPLQMDLLNELYNAIGNRTKQMALRVRDHNITFDSNAPDDRKIFERLRTLNEAFAILHVQTNAQGVHPFESYLELARIAGKLAVFSKDRTLPDDLPAYDHDNLGHCFGRLRRFIDDVLSGDFHQGFEMRAFVGAGLRMGVRIEPTWLAPAAQMYVGVESALPQNECIRMLTGRLNMKIGAAERVDEVFRLGLRGLDFIPVHEAPKILPPSKKITYFQVNRDVSKEEWDAVGQTYNLAIRLNERLLTGTIEGRQDITISADGRTATMRFTLYIILPAINRS